MEELGEFLGWVTGICFGASVLTFVVKRVQRMWIASLPKESKLRQIYQKIMQFVIKYHRYFGIGAAAAVSIHLLVQLSRQPPSYNGDIAAGLLLLTAILGAWMLYGRKGKLIKIHRAAALGGLAAFLLHLVIKG